MTSPRQAQSKKGKGERRYLYPAGADLAKDLFAAAKVRFSRHLYELGLCPVVHILGKKMIVHHGTVDRTGRQPPSPNSSAASTWSWSS